ncbi:lysosomal acid phosphatase-like isoform X2 [Atheta coriaria]
MINIGNDLRKRYEAFLGDVFYTDIVESTTSSYTRCQMSLQCVHAGLFPPNIKTGIPCKGLLWQAVPFKIIPFETDKLISIHIHCPKLIQNINPERIPQEDKELLEYIQEHSGFDKLEYLSAMRVYDIFKTSLEAGLELPDWVKPIWPEQLRNIAYKFWLHFQNKRRAIAAGPMIKQIIDQAKTKISEIHDPHGRKMYLYAVHDMNLHALRGALSIWDDQTVEYGAHLIFELHNIDDVYGFKIFFQNSYNEPKLMTIPGYDDFITLEEFENYTEEHYAPGCTCDDI